MDIRRFFLTFSGLGSRKNGTILAISTAAILGFFILCCLNGESLFMLAFAAAIVAIFEIDRYYGGDSRAYDDAIVVDKVVGVWLAETVATQTPSGVSGFYGLVAASALGAVLFFVFAKYRPSTIGWIGERIKGGLGAVLDDIVSGFAAGVLSVLLLKAAFALSAFW